MKTTGATKPRMLSRSGESDVAEPKQVEAQTLDEKSAVKKEQELRAGKPSTGRQVELIKGVLRSTESY